MLVLTRRENEGIIVRLPYGRAVRISVARISPEGTKVRIGIEAPDDIIVDREEIAMIKAGDDHRNPAT